MEERRPIRVDFAYIQRIEEAEEAKKKKAIAKSKGTRHWILGACLIALALSPGLLYVQSGVKRWQLSPTEKQLKGIAALCRGYGAAFGKPPHSMHALKAWGERLDKQKLEQFEIDNVETLFVSESDGQPFVLVQLPRGLVVHHY